jgi:DNA primase
MGPGKTLAVAMIAEGQDPDDLYRSAGAPALHAVLAEARPAVEALFAREQGREPLDTPERKSAFKKRLREAAFRIADEETRKLYLSDLMARADAALRPPRPEGGLPGQAGQYQRRPPGKFVKGKFEPDPRPTAESKARQAASPQHLAVENFLRKAVDQPVLAEKFGDLLARWALEEPDLAAIRDAILDLADPSGVQKVDREAVSRHLKERGEARAAARVSAWPPYRTPDAEAAADPVNEAAFEAEWMAAITLDVVLPALREEMAALAAAADRGDEAAFERFLMLDREARRIDEEFRAVRAPGRSSDQAA